MKKKLLALAVAGAFVAPVAMADTANVNVYGVLDVSYDSTTTNTPANSSSQQKVSSSQSRIGFKGAEDLGGGTSAMFQVEQGLNTDSGVWGAAARNTFVGLSGESWGTVLLGNNDTPYKTSTRKLDLFADTIADNRSLMGATTTKSAALGFDQRRTDVIQYNSPNMSGFAVSAQYAMGAESATTGTKGNSMALSGAYTAGPVYVALGWMENKFGTAGVAGSANAATGAATADHKEHAWKIGGSYTMDQFQVNAVYEQTSDDFGAGAGCGFTATSTDRCGHKAYYLGGKFNVTGSDAVKLSYTKAKEVNGGAATAANSGANQYAIGYDHNMSKRTTVYALYTRLSNDTLQSYSLGTASTGAVAVTADADPTALSIGIKHTF